MINIINLLFNTINMMLKYLYFYILSFFLIPFVCWMWLMYVNRLHLREKSRRLGSNMRKIIDNKISVDKFKIIRRLLLYQINAISESIAGITDGILNKEPIMRIYTVNNNNSQTDLERSDMSTQTDMSMSNNDDLQLSDNKEHHNVEIKRRIKIKKKMHDDYVLTKQ